MSTTIEDVLKKYKLVDKQLSSYDNDTIQTITEILNGKMNNYTNSENDVILLYIGLHCENTINNNNLAEKYYLASVKYNNVYAMNNLGLIYGDEHKLDLAEKYFLMAIKLGNANQKPLVACAMNNLGLLYYKLHKWDLAEKYFLMAAENDDTKALYNLGILYRDLHKLDLAEKYFLMAAEYDNNCPNALYILGNLYEEQNKLDFAEKYFLMAIQYDCSIAMNNLGLLYKKQRKLELAEKYYLMAIEHSSNIALYNLGSLYEMQHKFDSAIKYYLKAILFDADTIFSIIRLIPKLSHEPQLEILELVPQIRRTNEYFHKIHPTVRTLFMDKKIEMSRYLFLYLIDDLVNICLSYY